MTVYMVAGGSLSCQSSWLSERMLVLKKEDHFRISMEELVLEISPRVPNFRGHKEVLATTTIYYLTTTPPEANLPSIVILSPMEMSRGVGGSDEHLLYGAGDDYNPQAGDLDDIGSSTLDDDALLSSAPKKSRCSQLYLPIITRTLTAIIAISLIGLVFGLLPYYAVEAGKRGKFNQTLYWIAGVFVLITVPISVVGIVNHLVNWYMPQVQKVGFG
mgnify:CR=1 FL=1